MNNTTQHTTNTTTNKTKTIVYIDQWLLFSASPARKRREPNRAVDAPFGIITQFLIHPLEHERQDNQGTQPTTTRTFDTRDECTDRHEASDDDDDNDDIDNDDEAHRPKKPGAARRVSFISSLNSSTCIVIVVIGHMIESQKTKLRRTTKLRVC